METVLLQSGWFKALRSLQTQLPAWGIDRILHITAVAQQLWKIWRRWGWKERHIWCVTSCHPNTRYFITDASGRCLFMLLSHLIFTFWSVQISPFCRTQRPLLYCSAVCEDFLSVMTNDIGFWPGRGCETFLGQCSASTEMWTKKQIDEIPC